MDEAVRAAAQTLLGAAPCSVELPAGTGKTYLLAASVAVAAEEGQCSLILTHTNAGVDAIRKHLRQFGVPSGMARVETITSWAFSLVGAYSVIARISVGEVPDWTRSAEYLEGATAVARSQAIAAMHTISFSYLFVDEYQDCDLVQHEFVMAIVSAIPQSIILGDQLQAVFTFGGPMATWHEHVEPNFPAVPLEVIPHRWSGHNLELGQWLLNIRPSLADGQVFDFSAHEVPGLQYIASTSPATLASVAWSFRDYNESVVLLDKWPSDIAHHASRLRGTYLVMEDIGGRFMREWLEDLPREGDPQLAGWLAAYAKECFIGLSGVDTAVLRRLSLGQIVSHYTRPGLESVLNALEQLSQNPTYAQLVATAGVIRGAERLRMYRWEAWNDTSEAIAMTAENGGSAVDNLARVRDRLRRRGRRTDTRIASRTLLVKGLEYDHVIIANLGKMCDPCNLYVALSRARKSVTVLGHVPRITLRAGA